MADPLRTAALRAGRRPSLYVPEENQEWQEGQALIGPEAAWRRNYDFVLQQTGDPQKAEAAANRIARTENRQELTQLATSLAGPAMRGGELAAGLARRLMGGSRAAESSGAIRALPAPRRNAMYPEEMLTPDVVYGTSAENAPRLTYEEPLTQYRSQTIRPTGDRAGPPTRQQMEARSDARNPVIDETYSPLGRGEFGGSVRGTVDPLDVLAGEGGRSTEAVELAQRIARGNAENRALRLADEEARFAGGEGPNYAEDVLNRRRIAAGEEANFRANQLARMEDEGGGAGRQAAINELGRAAEADFRARQMGTWGDEAGAITSGRNPPNPVSRALQVIEGRLAPSGPGTGFTMIDTPGQGFTMVNPPNRAVAMRNVGSEAAGQEAASNWYNSSPVMADAAQRRSFMPNAGQLIGAGVPAAAAIGAMSPSQRPLSVPANYNTDSGAFNLVVGAGPGRGHLTEGAGDRYASMVGAGRGIVEEQPGERAKYQAAQDALQAARERAAPPMPIRRPEEGGLASLFSRPLSTKDLYQQFQDNPDDSGAYMRAERQFAKMHPDERSFDLTKLNEQGMASGGAAKPHKDAALHKALDIISHMLGRH